MTKDRVRIVDTFMLLPRGVVNVAFDGIQRPAERQYHVTNCLGVAARDATGGPDGVAFAKQAKNEGLAISG